MAGIKAVEHIVSEQKKIPIEDGDNALDLVTVLPCFSHSCLRHCAATQPCQPFLDPEGINQNTLNPNQVHGGVPARDF